MVSLVSIIKLVINPIIAIGIFYLLGINGFEFTIGIIQSAMPCAMFTLAFAIDYDLDVKLSSDCIIISMIISLITLPILISII
jgi:predicted permease